MPFSFHNDVLDAALNELSEATALHITSGTAPTAVADVTSRSLATAAVTAGNFADADHSGGGRQTTVAAKSGVPVTATGTPTHYVLVDATRVLAVTEVDPATPGFTSGSTTDIPAVVFAVGDPVAG